MDRLAVRYQLVDQVPQGLVGLAGRAVEVFDSRR